MKLRTAAQQTTRQTAQKTVHRRKLCKKKRFPDWTHLTAPNIARRLVFHNAQSKKQYYQTRTPQTWTNNMVVPNLKTSSQLSANR
mmetsp:Transcript_27389/g.62425  ORF Transcript_27389/g.62425 Transcript_27389/m.62425 type:complete len:85 (+) Transcript_27389:1916-2170(+)